MELRSIGGCKMTNLRYADDGNLLKKLEAVSREYALEGNQTAE